MIYDCFTFFNELDLLEIRLNVLNDVVDKFVIVEATKTFSGTSKPLYFKDNRERFEKFREKIIHIIVDDMPDAPKNRNGNWWQAEFFQRNAITRGLKQCKNTDVILIGDLDEIPNPQKIKKYKDKPGIHVFVQKMFLYYLNDIDLREPYWTNSSTRMLSYGDFIKNGSSPQKTKFLRGHLIFNGGWHFTYLGGDEKVSEKISSFTHVINQSIVEKYKDRSNIRERINSGGNLFDFNKMKRYAGIPLDKSFPPMLLIMLFQIILI